MSGLGSCEQMKRCGGDEFSKRSRIYVCSKSWLGGALRRQSIRLSRVTQLELGGFVEHTNDEFADFTHLT
jgi:hypothetical protein